MGGKATVLEVYRFDPRNPIAVDDEGCDILLIELPRPSPGSPFTVESPRAFLRRCACTWGNCKEEASLGGHVRIEESTDQGIKAAVNLRFPSGRVKTRGWFRFEAPKLWDAAPGTVLEPR